MEPAQGPRGNHSCVGLCAAVCVEWVEQLQVGQPPTYPPHPVWADPITTLGCDIQRCFIPDRRHMHPGNAE